MSKYKNSWKKFLADFDDELRYLVKDGYDPDDKGQRGDQSLSDSPLG